MYIYTKYIFIIIIDIIKNRKHKKNEISFLTNATGNIWRENAISDNLNIVQRADWINSALRMTRRVRRQDPYRGTMTGRYSDTVVVSRRLESSKVNEPQLATRKDCTQAWTRARTHVRTARRARGRRKERYWKARFLPADLLLRIGRAKKYFLKCDKRSKQTAHAVRAFVTMVVQQRNARFSLALVIAMPIRGCLP